MQSKINCDDYFQKFTKLIQFENGSGAFSETSITLLSKVLHINAD